jgi:hypothetical protein
VRKQSSSGFSRHVAVIAAAAVLSVLLLGAGVFVLTHLSLTGALVALGSLAVVWAIVRFAPALRTRRGADGGRSASPTEERRRHTRERFGRGSDDHQTLQ